MMQVKLYLEKDYTLNSYGLSTGGLIYCTA